RRVWRVLVGPGLGRLVATFCLAALAASACAMATPIAIAAMFDGVVAKETGRVISAVIALIVLHYALVAAEYVSDRSHEFTIGEIIGRVDGRINELFFEKSVGQHVSEASRLSTANTERGLWRSIEMGSTLLQIVPVAAEIIVVYGLLWWLSPWTGVAATLLIVNHVGWTLVLNGRIVRESDAIEEQWRALGRYRSERWDQVERVMVNGRRETERKQMADMFSRLIADDRHLWLWAPKIFAGRSAVSFTIIIAALSYGLWLVSRGQMTVGALYPLFAWLSTFGRQAIQLGRLEQRLAWNAPSVIALVDALSLAPDVTEKPDAVSVPTGDGIRVEFDGLTHCYGAGESKGPPAVLENVSFVVEPGEKVALLGPSGAGKTTVMRLLQRYMDPGAGAIRVNGVDLRDLKIDSWRSLVGYVPQSPQVLDGTIRYNLTYGLPVGEDAAMTDDALWSLMRLLRVDFGKRLTEGLETKVGRRGLKLSGGQAQRLMLGAAVAKKPKFLIIDEATSSLDSTTEKEVQSGLAKALQGQVGALIIAHRLSTVREICDKFVVLRPTEEVGEGEPQVEAVANSFEELYVVSPTFRRLADDQGLAIT
ncbi:MAG: ABC transporter ATP-binding protein, partial [Patescibacteria group bacterium]|nr:ABC transporter ATP-binding protein [Patescibacteria group bacterium]